MLRFIALTIITVIWSAVIIFWDRVPYNYLVSISLIAIFAAIKNYSAPTENRSGSAISLWQSLTPLPECRECFISMLGGCLVLFSGLLAAVFAIQADRYIFGGLLGLGASIYGGFLISEYPGCLQEYEKGYRNNDT
jgi:hypothetical protein